MASFLERGKELVGRTHEQITTKAGESIEKARQIYAAREAIGEALSSLVTEGVNVDDLKAAGYGVTGGVYREKKKQAAVALLNLGGSVRHKVLLAIRESVKEAAVEDPDMWSCARTNIESLIDILWDDLTIYIETMENDKKEAVRGRQINTLEGLETFGDKPCICSPRWWRALVLYRYLPFDISVFGQVKDPFFWLLTIISMVPSYGIRVIFFSVISLFHLTACPPDEYQLVGYILTFKGTQFLSSGVAMAVFAAVKYYLCIHPGGTHTCDKDGPGASSDLISGSIDFLGSVVLVWIAFLVLPCSTRYAGSRDIGEKKAEETKETELELQVKRCCCCSWDPKRGGRLSGLLGYDLCVFLLSCGLLYGLMYTDTAHLRPGGEEADMNVDQAKLLKEMGTWQFRTAVFWARVFYSCLAFPFTIFYLPVLSGILTHTTVTGYNRRGLCVPYWLHPVPKPEE